MGRRSRKRRVAPALAGARPAHPSARVLDPDEEDGDPHERGRFVERPDPPPLRRHARREEAPVAPWHPVPLVELAILLGLILVVVAFVGGGDRRGTLLACGIALVSLGGLELALREHFSGFRSHSTLLGGIAAVGSAVPLYFFTDVRQEVLLALAVLVFGLAFVGARAAFRRRSGLTWRA